jgi:hypothetical protein
MARVFRPNARVKYPTSRVLLSSWLLPAMDGNEDERRCREGWNWGRCGRWNSRAGPVTMGAPTNPWVMTMEMMDDRVLAMVALTAIARLNRLLVDQGGLPAGALAAELLQASEMAKQDVQFAQNAALQRALAQGLASLAAKLSAP